jgi:hypothetical protein
MKDPHLRLSSPQGPMFTLCALLLLTLACRDQRTSADSAAPRTVGSAARAAELTDTFAIAARADSIDRYMRAHPGRVKLFAKISERASLVAVKDNASWPEHTEISYNTVADVDGHPLIHVQVPASQSGDWFAVETHYFAPDGHTILHQYSISGFSSGCGDILRELKRTFLTPTGAVLAQSRRFTDGKDRPVVADTCYRRSDDAPAPQRAASQLPFAPMK